MHCFIPIRVAELCKDAKTAEDKAAAMSESESNFLEKVLIEESQSKRENQKHRIINYQIHRKVGQII